MDGGVASVLMPWRRILRCPTGIRWPRVSRRCPRVPSREQAFAECSEYAIAPASGGGRGRAHRVNAQLLHRAVDLLRAILRSLVRDGWIRPVRDAPMDTQAVEQPPRQYRLADPPEARPHSCFFREEPGVDPAGRVVQRQDQVPCPSRDPFMLRSDLVEHCSRGGLARLGISLAGGGRGMVRVPAPGFSLLDQARLL